MSTQAALVAAAIARIVAQADLAHPVSAAKGDEQALSWADLFIRMEGEPAARTEADQLAAYEAAMKEFVFRQTVIEGYAPIESTLTAGYAGLELDFERQLAMALAIRSIPPWVARSAAHDLLTTKVREEVCYRAMDLLTLSEKVDGPLAVVRDGRFKVLQYRGMPVATAGGDTSPSPKEWREMVMGNLDLVGQGEHSVSVSIDGRQVLRTSATVVVEVHNDRMAMDDDDGVTQDISMTAAFTSEGVITDLVTHTGVGVGTEASLYDDIAARLVNFPEGAPGDTPAG